MGLLGPPIFGIGGCEGKCLNFRGYGLQKQFIAWKDEEGRRMGAKWALCTVSPDNPNSLNNTLRAGFEIVEEKEMYGGIRRYVLRKALA